MNNKLQSWHARIYCYFVVMKMKIFPNNDPFREATNYHFLLHSYMLFFLLFFIFPITVNFSPILSTFILIVGLGFTAFLFILDLLYYRNCKYGDFKRAMYHLQIIKLTKNEKIKNKILKDLYSFIDLYYKNKHPAQYLKITREIEKLIKTNYDNYKEQNDLIENIKKIKKEKESLERLEDEYIKELRKLENKWSYIDKNEETQTIKEKENITINND